MGGILSPLFSQTAIDLTDGVCSRRFLESAEVAALSYHEELGVPRDLADLIDSSYIDHDQISAIIYIFLAHIERGLEDVYLADMARVIESAGCFELPESLFLLHLERNPDDDRAIGDYALLLTRSGEYEKAADILERRIKDVKKDERAGLYNDLALVRLREYAETEKQKSLKKAFQALRMDRFGNDMSRSEFRTAKLKFQIEFLPHAEEGKFHFTLRIINELGSDAVILWIRTSVVFAREIESEFFNDDLEDIRDLFGSFYIVQGDTLVTEPGGFEISGDIGRFARFYEGTALFECAALYPNGLITRCTANPSVVIKTENSLFPIYDALAYGEVAFAESTLTALNARGKRSARILPPRWRASIQLSSVMEDSSRWEYGLQLVDSLINEELNPNLWVYKGALLYLLGRPEEAVHPLKQAIEADSSNFWAVYDLALVEYDLGNKVIAADLFLQTAKINRRMYVANLLAGVIFEELGLLGRALEQYNLAFSEVNFRSLEVMEWIDELEGNKSKDVNKSPGKND